MPTTYKLKVQNYQILKSAEIDIKQGLTLIQGHSNHGKSSLFKAFRQLLYNNSGTDYIRHGSNQCTISLSLHQGDTPVYYIEYQKSKTKSQYTIQTPQNGTEVYQKLGSSQLDQIKNLTNIDKQLDYNFWSQMEKPFLIGLTPREQFDILQNSPHSTTLQNCLHQMTEDRKTYQRQEVQHQAKLELLQQQNNQFTTQLIQLPTVDRLFHQMESLRLRNDVLQNLSSLLRNLTQVTKDLIPLNQKLTSLQNIPSLEHLNTLYDQIQSISSKYKALQQSVYPINELQNSIQNLSTEYERIHLFTQQHFPNCPLCNQPFHNHQ